MKQCEFLFAFVVFSPLKRFCDDCKRFCDGSD